MTALIGIAARSAWNRRGNLLLMVLAIALSTALLLGVERLRQQVRGSFAQSVSGTDLIVGARGNPLQLVLYTVFRIGQVDGNISWQSVQRLANHPLVAWTVPVSLGDSHRGFPVLATTTAYFEHFRYGDHRPLRIEQGHRFDGLFDAVIGAEVAHRLGYRLGDQIALSHGESEPGQSDHGNPHHGQSDDGHDAASGKHERRHEHRGADHGDKPFTVVGILARTGTPVDRTVHIGMEAMQAIHLDFQGGARLPGMAIPPEYVRRFDLTPKSATAVLVGLKLRSRVFTLQREIAEDTREPLTAVLPGVALDTLWDTVRTAETTMRAISAMVAVVGLAGLASSILAALGARRRELAILRAAGARPRDIVALVAMEGMMLMLCGASAGVLLLTAASGLFSGWLEASLGVALPFAWPTMAELPTLLALILAGFLASLLPAWRAYRLSLADGLNPRL